jgi:hypothetical protein
VQVQLIKADGVPQQLPTVDIRFKVGNGPEQGLTAAQKLARVGANQLNVELEVPALNLGAASSALQTQVLMLISVGEMHLSLSFVYMAPSARLPLVSEDGPNPKEASIVGGTFVSVKVDNWAQPMNKDNTKIHFGTSAAYAPTSVTAVGPHSYVFLLLHSCSCDCWKLGCQSRLH